MANKKQIRRKFYITLEVEIDCCYDYDENEAKKMLNRIANSTERNGVDDKYYVQHIGTVSIVDEKGGMLWARR